MLSIVGKHFFITWKAMAQVASRGSRLCRDLLGDGLGSWLIKEIIDRFDSAVGSGLLLAIILAATLPSHRQG